MKKYWKPIVLLAAILVMVYGVIGSGAWFSDLEGVENNSFQAGWLDLELGASASLPFSVVDIKPGDTGVGQVTLSSKAGGLDGLLSAKIANYAQDENGCIEPEISAGDPCDAGDLGLALQMAMFLDVNQNGIYDAGDVELEYSGNTNTTPGLQFANLNQWNGDQWIDVLPMASGDTVDLVIQWRFPHNSYAKPDAIFMTDKLSFDVVLELKQAD